MDTIRLHQVDILQSQRTILQNVNLRLARSEFAYLIGKTGSGKSSLLKTLYGALPLHSGTARVAGFDLGTLTRKSIPSFRRKLGIIFQDFRLLPDRNVAENLKFVLRATGWRDTQQINHRIDELLEQVDLKGVHEQMPHALSGGEQQRVVIARALLNRPEIILADEPTGHLDPETSDDILLLLRQLTQHQRTAVLFATHDYRTLEQFPARIIRVLNGSVIEEEHLEL
ncbi:MAG: ATP-binding cassette domain-containing protein [Bacteroidota bacterium]